MSTDNIKWNRQQKELVTIPSVCLVVGTFAVGLRLLSRRIFRAKIWWDDYLCLFALVRLLPLRAGSHQAIDSSSGSVLLSPHTTADVYVETAWNKNQG